MQVGDTIIHSDETEDFVSTIYNIKGDRADFTDKHGGVCFARIKSARLVASWEGKDVWIATEYI